MTPNSPRRAVPVTITIGEALELLANEQTLVLDARDAPSYKAGHLNRAMLLHDGLMESIIKSKNKEQPLLLYCFRGNTSLEKAQLFCAAGFKNVYNLAGGYIAWMKRDKSGEARSTV